MTVKNEKFLVQTQGCNDIIDITLRVDEAVKKSAVAAKFKNAAVHIFSPGSTVSITTIEYEPGLVRDIPEILDELIPQNKTYHHDETWHDGNGYAHIRAAFIGNGINVPFVNGELELGNWQQIVLMDFDNKPRTRSIIVQTIY